MDVSFKVNGKMLNLRIEAEQHDLMFKLTNDDDFTVNYIKSLIENNFIKIQGDLRIITRIEGDEEVSLFNKGDDKEVNSNPGKEESDQRDYWGDPGTKFLLDKYEMYLPMVGPLKKFKKKKALWEQISKDLQNVLNISKTPMQVENRYKTLLKRKKKAVEHNRRTGESPVDVPFEDELAKISSQDDSIEPEVLVSANKRQIVKQTTMAIAGLRSTKKIKTVQETLIEIHQQKEEARERRHQEKMELIRAFLQTVENNKE